MKSIARLVLSGLVLGTTLAGVQAMPASADAVVFRQHGAALDCYTADGDIPGVPSFQVVDGRLTAVVLPTGGLEVSCTGRLPANVILEETYTATVVCEDELGLHPGRIVATTSGRISITCHDAQP
jgi:hypothetical protein